MEDGEAESDQALDIDEFSDDESIVDYEEDDDFSSNVNTQQQKKSSLSGEKEKAEIPDGDTEHWNTDQNRNGTDAGTVDEVIELSLNDNQLPQGADNHSDEEMWESPKCAKTGQVLKTALFLFVLVVVELIVVVFILVTVVVEAKQVVVVLVTLVLVKLAVLVVLVSVDMVVVTLMMA